MKEIDCKGLACPAPVLKTKEAVEKEMATDITVIVDNEAAKQNVERFLATKKYQTSVKEEGGIFYVHGKSTGLDNAIDGTEIQKEPGAEQKIAVMVTTDVIGHGDDELGSKLMASFIKTLSEMGEDLWRLIFLNNGVKLTVDGAGTLEDLKALEKEGIHILVCGTCLTHFNLLEKKRVGETTNMLDIVTALQLADKVINL